MTGQKGAFNFYGESNQSENISVQRFIGTTQYAAGDASMLPKVVVTSDAEDIAYPSSSFVAGKRSRREAGRIRIYLLQTISLILLDLLGFNLTYELSFHVYFGKYFYRKGKP